MLLALTIINYIDRQTLSGPGPILEKEYRWNNTDFVRILFAFRVAYAVGRGLCGRLMDRVGTRRRISITVAFYFAVVALTATARGLGSFGVFRFLLDSGEAANTRAANSETSNVFCRAR